MKTERRHELQKNQLADQLSHGIEAARPYTRLLGAVLLAIVALVGGYAAYSARQSHKLQQAWDQYFAALEQASQVSGPTDPAIDKARNQLTDLAEKYAGTPVGYWSALVAAELELDRGEKLLLSDKPLAKDHLTRAVDQFRTVLSNAPQGPLPQRALFGLARAHESLGDLEKARDEYDKLAKQYPTGPYAEVAKQRAEDLNRDETKKFYDWLASYQPSKSMSKEPGIPGQKQDFSLDNLGSEPGSRLPSVVDDALPSANGKSDQGLSLPPISDALKGAPAIPGADQPQADVLDSGNEPPSSELPGSEQALPGVESPTAKDSPEPPATSPQPPARSEQPPDNSKAPGK